jgi:hypothetical protein
MIRRVGATAFDDELGALTEEVFLFDLDGSVAAAGLDEAGPEPMRLEGRQVGIGQCRLRRRSTGSFLVHRCLRWAQMA